MEPSSTITLDSIDLLLVTNPAAEVVASILETSWNMTSLTEPVSLICGFTRSVIPTSFLSKVVKGVTDPLAVLLFVYCPVAKGTFWPTTIFASSLSSVSSVGVDKTLVKPSC